MKKTLFDRQITQEIADSIIAVLDAQMKLLIPYTETPINEHDGILIATCRIGEAIDQLKKL